MFKKTRLILAVLLVMSMASAAVAEDVVLMPSHGSLWKLAEECGQPGSAWPAVVAKNPWIKVKVIRGKKIPVVHPGQPVVLPDDWVGAIQENEGEPNILASLWNDFLDMAKAYPVPCIIIIFMFGAAITAKEYLPRRGQKKIAAQYVPQKNNRQYESIVLPG